MSELQDENQFGKRGEAWTVGELAVMVLVLLPPFTLTVRLSWQSSCTNLAAIACVAVSASKQH